MSGKFSCSGAVCEEGAALFAYLRSVPAVSRKTPGPPRERPTPTSPPEDLAVIYGCTVCHGDRAPHQALLKQAAAVRSAADLATSIRHPESRLPETQMPTYAAVIGNRRRNTIGATAAKISGSVMYQAAGFGASSGPPTALAR